MSHNPTIGKEPSEIFQNNPLYDSPDNLNGSNKLYKPADETDEVAASVFGSNPTSQKRVYRASSNNIPPVTGGTNHRSWIRRIIDGVIAFFRGFSRKPSNNPQPSKTGTPPKVVINPSNSDSKSSETSSAQTVPGEETEVSKNLDEVKADKKIDEPEETSEELQSMDSFINERIVKLEKEKEKLITIAKQFSDQYDLRVQEIKKYENSTDVFEQEQAIELECILEEMKKLLTEIQNNCTIVDNNLAILRQIKSDNQNQALSIADQLQSIDLEDLKNKFSVLENLNRGSILIVIRTHLLWALGSHNQLLLKFTSELNKLFEDDKLFEALIADAQKDLAQGN